MSYRGNNQGVADGCVSAADDADAADANVLLLPCSRAGKGTRVATCLSLVRFAVLDFQVWHSLAADFYGGRAKECSTAVTGA